MRTHTSTDSRTTGSTPTPTDPQEGAIAVVAATLHRECTEWTWTAHGPGAHRAAAHDIVRALRHQGWTPT